MKNVLYPVTILYLLLITGFVAVKSTKWEISEDYSIKFTSKNPSGIFKSLTGEINFDESDLEGSGFDMIVDAASINTGNGIKNKHAKGSNWLDVKTYPEIRFESNKITKTSDGYEVRGILDLHGVRNEITFPFTFSENTFTGSFVINRFDYNMSVSKGPQGKAADVMQVDISIPVTR